MITIKRHSNRKLYSEVTKSYINFETIREFLLRGQPFKVESQGKDITKETVQKVNIKYGLPKEIMIDFI